MGGYVNSNTYFFNPNFFDSLRLNVTYIVPPEDPMYGWMSLDVTLKVHIVPLLQVPKNMFVKFID